MRHPDDSNMGFVDLPVPLSVAFDAKDYPARLTANRTVSAALDGFGRGGGVVGLTFGQFSTIDLVSNLLSVVGDGAALGLCTWSCGWIEALALGRWVEYGRVSDLRLLCDQSMKRGQLPLGELVTFLGAVERVRTTRTHAKFAVLSGDGWHITVTASMNLNENVRVEQFEVVDSKVKWEFFTAYLDAIWKHLPPPSEQPQRRSLPKAILSEEVFKQPDADSKARDFGVRVGRASYGVRK